MTDFSPMLALDAGQPARTIHLVDKANWPAWFKAQPERARTAIAAQRMKLEGYAHAILPGDGPDDWYVVSIVANVHSFSSWCLSKLAGTLPAGTYRMQVAEGGERTPFSTEPGVAMFGWLVGQHKFTRYKKGAEAAAPLTLLSGDPVRMAAILAEAEAVCRVRDLVDTPASDLGPAELEAAVSTLSDKHKAVLTITRGDALEQGYPMIAAVGRAAEKARAPRLIELTWGRADAPKIAIIGKGVTFDSGGLDIKPAAGMGLMKKDMGGAAHALALAGLVMDAGLPVRLHLLIPAVENSIAGDAMRPGDILRSRNGLDAVQAHGIKTGAHQQDHRVAQPRAQPQQHGPRQLAQAAHRAGMCCQGKKVDGQAVQLVLLVLLHHAFLHQALQQAVGGGLGEAQRFGQMGDAHAFVLVRGQRAQDQKTAVQGTFLVAAVGAGVGFGGGGHMLCGIKRCVFGYLFHLTE